MVKLYQYQDEGAEWLASKERALLADEPGLGKSGQCVRACDILCVEQILIIPPASVRAVWKMEIYKFSIWGYPINVVDSVAKFAEGPKPGVNIVNYDLFSYGFEKNNFRFNALMRKWLIEWHVVIADEAHFLKEPESLRTRAVLENRGLNGHTQRLWLVSGTPMPNHPGELWCPLAGLGATDLSYQQFVDKYCEVGKKGYSVGKPIGTKKEAVKELKELLRSVMKRRYKKLVMPQLPPIRIDDFPLAESKIKIEQFFEDALIDKANLTRKIKAEEEFITEVWQRAIGSGGKMSMNDMMTVLQGVGPSVGLYRRWLGAVKASGIAPILIDELENKAYDKIVIFAHHKQVVQFLKAKLIKFGPVVIDGSVNPRAREKAMLDFQNDPSARVFIGNTIAAGTGLTLTAASEVVMLEPDWVPSNNAQAIMRCHRIGQKNAVRARFVRLADTLDDYISDTLARKTREITAIVDD